MANPLLQHYIKLTEFLGQALGPDYEVALHDMTDKNRSIVAIANNHISGREIGAPLTNMALLTEETGEVARIIARRYGQQSEKESDKAKDLGEELADVVFVALCLANQTGIDLQEAFDRKLELKTRRDHDRHHNNPKLQE